MRRKGGIGQDAPPEPQAEWIDEGPVREEAVAAVERAERRRTPSDLSPTLAAEVDGASGGGQRAARLRERLLNAYEALERERFGDARRMANALVRELSSVAAVHEIIGLANYRMGNWRPAVAALERSQDLRAEPSTLPVLMDCLRALGRHRDVASVWNELKGMSPSHEVMAEGRIVAAGSLADGGDLGGAIALMEPATARPKRVRDHHLRQWYVLADLHDRAGDVIAARRWFERILSHDDDFVDVLSRLRQLGR